MQKLPRLRFGKYYHVFNRGINRENIFIEARNYAYFLQAYAKYIAPVADTFAYCLMRNHFHLLVRIKETFEVSETSKVLAPTQQFSNLFNAYAKAINKAYGRTGSLFEGRFGRIEVKSAAYFTNLVAYIHRNPQRHGFVDDFREYPYSSYPSILSDRPTQLNRREVIKWFGNPDTFQAAHRSEPDLRVIRYLIENDVFDA